MISNKYVSSQLETQQCTHCFSFLKMCVEKMKKKRSYMLIQIYEGFFYHDFLRYIIKFWGVCKICLPD